MLKVSLIYFVYEKQAKFFTAFYLLYVKLEEQYGLARHAMSIYERATAALPDGEKLEV